MLGGMVSDGLRGPGELETAKLDNVWMCIHLGRMQQQQQQPVVVPTTTQQEVARLNVLLSLSCLEYPMLDAKLPSFWSDHLSFLMPAALRYSTVERVCTLVLDSDGR